MAEKDRSLIAGIVKIALFIISGVFFVAISYVLHLLIEHPYFLASGDVYAHPRIYTHAYFQFALYTVCASGFALLVILAGEILSMSRMHRRTKILYAAAKGHMRAIESANDGIAILDENGVYTYMNQAHAACYGYSSAQDMIGKNWRSLYTADRVREFENDIFPLIRRDGKWSGTGKGRRVDGSEFMQELSLAHLEDGGLVCVVRDVDEKMRCEAQMRMILMGVEAADDGIAIAAPDNRLLFMNRRYLTIHGYDPDERERYIGTDWRLLYNEAGQGQIDRDVLPTTMMKGSWSGSIAIMRRDGSLFPADASLTKMPDGNVLGVVRDVSERMNMKRETDEMRDRLFHAHRLESIIRMNVSIAENFNDILSNMNRYAELLKIKAKDDPSFHHFIRNIDDAYLKSSDLVGRMLTIVQGPEAAADCVDIAHVIRNALPDLPYARFNMYVDEAVAPMNAASLREVIVCVTNNARESMGEEGGVITITLNAQDDLTRDLAIIMEVTGAPVAAVRLVGGRHGRRLLACGFLMAGRSYCRLTISDGGVGISPEVLPHIFDPRISTKYGGGRLGLGLSKTQRIVAAAGGAILIESAEGAGTDVHLFLPLADAGSRAPSNGVVNPVGEDMKA